MIKALTRDKRLLLSSLLIITLALSFWTGSRVPQLNEKASMGAETNMTTLGFDTVFKVQPDDGLVKTIAYTTVNWMDTNKKGMTFGVLFAAALMTIFSLLRRRSFKSGFANSALGLAIGTPLGVCVNCAAPIAAGMASAGSRLETTLATMISSPTMNVIVLTMLLSLFPPYMVVIKIGLTLVFILIVIPLMCRYFLKDETRASSQDAEFGEMDAGESCSIPQIDALTLSDGSNWIKSLRWLVVNYAKNFWFVFKRTVPLMVLAGFLGAIMITILPWGALAEIIPDNSKFMIIVSMFFIASVGLFLPVPIAFDVLVSAVLLAAGMPVKYVMVLLFTLGIYSIYSYFVVTSFISKRAAFAIYLILIPFGVAAGVAGQYFNQKEIEKNKTLMLDHFKSLDEFSEFDYSLPETVSVKSQQQVLLEINSNRPLYTHVSTFENDSIVLDKAAFELPVNPSSGAGFINVSPEELGISEQYKFSFLKLTMPISLGYGRTLSSGDVHNDGRTDLLFVTEHGISLYANNGDKKFLKQDISNSDIARFYVTNASLIDLNNDGWQDLLFTTMSSGNYLIYNNEGAFDGALVKLPKGDDKVMTTALAYADIDRDGDIDIVTGNWSIARGKGARLSSERSTNEILINTKNGFELKVLDSLPGVPLTMMLSDINNDNKIDLVIGNDFEAPDYFFFGDGEGGFMQITKQDGVIPYSTRDTMSITSADVNNDLSPEIYMGDIARYPDNHEEYFTKKVPEVCDEITNTADLRKCKEYENYHQMFFSIVRTNDVQKCLDIEDIEYRNQCTAFFFARKPSKHGGTQICDSLPGEWKSARTICHDNVQLSYVSSESDLLNAITQQTDKNVMLTMGKDGKYIDIAEDMGLNLAGWTWNAKFSDIDNDEWQDLFVTTGWIEAEKRRESNYFFKNIEGKKFENLTNEYNMSSFLATSSYVYIDLENDGDLDIVSIPMNGPISIKENIAADENNAIDIMLVDEKGNTSGVGSKIYIYYGDNESRHQYREIQAGGGFLSFEQPMAHFGLGEHESVSRIDVVWSTGETTVLAGDFPSGARYRVTRTN